MKKEKLIIKPRRVKGDDGYRVFSVRVKEEVVKEIDDLAMQTGRSRNELIGIFLEYGLSQYEIEDPSKDE